MLMEYDYFKHSVDAGSWKTTVCQLHALGVLSEYRPL